jgi:hypothetical protein
MATNSYFFSSSVPAGQDRPYSAPAVGAASSGPVGSLNSGTATYASDAFELRITTVSTGYAVTKRDALNFLEQAKRWILEQEGSTASSGSGLDALILANTGVGVP